MSTAPMPATGTTTAPFNVMPVGIRYSLPQLLREVQLERKASGFGMEKLEQVEIAKLFQKNRPRRGAKRK